MAGLAPVWYRVTDLEVETGAGSWVTARDGRRYLDMTAGIAVASTGHCHPHVVEAIQRQASRFVHAQCNVYRHDQLQPLVAALDDATPGLLDTFFFTNSGAEAVEAAVKLAKQATGRTQVVTFDGGFHGRTHLTAAMTTSKAVYRVAVQPLPAGLAVAPFPRTEAESGEAEAALEQLLESQVHPADLAAFVIEPILGEGGCVPAPGRFLRFLRAMADRTGALLILDEVQTGIGRTGRMFALEHHAVVPDVLVMAKGLASGFPMASIAAADHLMAGWIPGSHGGTFGGNPMACAAAVATLEVVSAPGFLDDVERKGEALTAALLDLEGEPFREVRGLGLMKALVFDDPARADAVRRHCLSESAVIFMPAGRHNEALRLTPPLTISDDELAIAVQALDRAMAAAV